MAIADLTDQNNRMLRDYLPSLSDRTPGFDLAGLLQSLINELDLIQKATTQLGAADVTATFAFPTVPVGAVITATLNGGSGGSSTTTVLSAVRDSATEVTVTVDQAPGGGETHNLSVVVDARS